MTWFNGYGLIFMAVIMVPNIIFAYTRKDGFANKYQNKAVEALEQIGRFGCFLMMCLNIPYLCLGYWFGAGETVYLILGSALVLLYCVGWVVFRKTSSLAKSITLSVLPSLLFLSCGILSRNIPLIILSLLFAPCHILISVKNARRDR